MPGNGRIPPVYPETSHRGDLQYGVPLLRSLHQSVAGSRCWELSRFYYSCQAGVRTISHPWARARAHDCPCIHQRRRFGYSRWLGGRRLFPTRNLLPPFIPSIPHPVIWWRATLKISDGFHRGTTRIISRYTSEGLLFEMVFHHDNVDHRGHARHQQDLSGCLFLLCSTLVCMIPALYFPRRCSGLLEDPGIVCMLNGYANALNFVLCQAIILRTNDISCKSPSSRCCWILPSAK